MTMKKLENMLTDELGLTEVTSREMVAAAQKAKAAVLAHLDAVKQVVTAAFDEFEQATTDQFGARAAVLQEMLGKEE